MAIELVAGLGNPGERYAATRHNVGFKVVDEVARRLEVGDWRDEYFSQVAAVQRDSGQLWLAKPRTYMNRSGSALAMLAAALAVEPCRMFVVVDDVDLDVGRLRVRRSGGPGTHNGLKDVVNALGTGFPRLRFGVRGTDPWDDLADYVLTPFADDEEAVVRDAVERAAAAVEMAVTEGIERAMNVFNRRCAS